MVSISQKPYKRPQVSKTALLLLVISALIIATVKREDISAKVLKSGGIKEVNFSAYYSKIEEEKPSEGTPMLRLSPSIKNVYLNIGANFNPIMPDEALGPCAHTIAVEPMIPCEIKSHPQLSVIPAAIADKPGVMSMKKLNWSGQSSSLANVAPHGIDILQDGEYTIVPVITLSSLLSSIPPTAKISLMMIDIQGLDFTIVKSGALILKERVTHLITEVWKEDKYTYETENDLCRDWIPFMEELGYTLLKTESMAGEDAKAFCKKWIEEHPIRPTSDESPGMIEENAYWVRKDAVGEPFPEFPLLPRYNPKFTPEDYKRCE